MTRRITALAVAAVTVLAGTAACSKSNSGNNSNKTLVVGVDLPYQGAQKDTSNATLNAMQLYLDSVGGKAGNYKVQLKQYDDSTAATGKWEDNQCRQNADAHVANTNEVAVMGTYNSGCAKLEVPKLNQDTTGPLLMISNANTNPGLTKKWDANEPEKYYPSGKRNYARVITTDDIQGPAGARFAAKDLSVKKVYIINDSETYGQGVGKAFQDEAAKQGLTVLGNQVWDGKQPNYTALFNNIKATNPDAALVGLRAFPDDRVVLVDYEIATDIGDPTPRGLGDQAFAAPRDRTGYDIDRYALACLRLAMFLPLTAVLRFAPGKARHYADVIAEHFELPPGFLDEAVRVINGSRPAPPRATEIGDWPATRAALAGAILASATPDRSDRLFPGDIEQFAVGGGLNLAYGAAGVLYTLAVTGAGRYPEHEEWFARRAPRPDSGARCGFYDGLHGMAYVLHRLGRAEEARKVLDISLDQKWDRYGLDLFGGLSGIALNLRYFADVTDDPALAEQASRAVDLVAERLGDVTSVPEVSGEEYPYAGLLYGSSGPALLFLHEYARTGDPSRLDLAAVALRQDLRRCVRRDDGQLHVNEGWRTMPYLAKGSVGIGLVLDRYLAHHADEEFADASTAIHRAATAAFYAQSGLSAGRAGIIYYLADRARRHPAARAELAAQIHRLAWHGVPYRGHLAFPGEQLLRLSMDLATGTAGVLLSLGAALHHEPVDLPFLAPVDPADVPDNRGGETNPNETWEEVSPDGTAGPASDGAGR